MSKFPGRGARHPPIRMSAETLSSETVFVSIRANTPVRVIKRPLDPKLRKTTAMTAKVDIDRLQSISNRLGDAVLDPVLGRIQNDLFDVEADLCLSEKGPGGARLTVTDAQVDWLEGEIDRFNAELEPLRSFILPGGSHAAAYLHLARTVCRRAERIMVELKDQPGEHVTPPSLKYVNRLSDFLFVAGRYANDKGARDVLWAPGQNR